MSNETEREPSGAPPVVPSPNEGEQKKVGSIRSIDGDLYYDDGEGSLKAVNMGDTDAFTDYSQYSPDLQASLQKYKRGELSKDLGIGLGLQALESAALIAPTAMDTQNRRELAELERKRDAGLLGLEGDERAALERGTLAPVQALAGEQQRRDEARIASMGGSASVADLTRAAREGRGQVARQARAAGLTIEQMELQRKRDQIRELEQRKAAQGRRQAEMLRAAAQIPAGVAGGAGAIRAARAVPMPDIKGLQENNWSDDEIAILLNEVNQANRLPPALRGRVLENSELLGDQREYLEAMLDHGDVGVPE